MSKFLYKYCKTKNNNIWYDESNSITSENDSTKYPLFKIITNTLSNSDYIKDNFDLFFTDSSFNYFPCICLKNDTNKTAFVMNNVLYNYLVRADTNFDVKSYICTLLKNNINNLKFNFWVKNIKQIQYKYDIKDLMLLPYNTGYDIYKLSLIVSHENDKLQVYVHMWPIMFIYDEELLSSDIEFLKKVLAVIDNSDKAMFLLIHAPIFYGTYLNDYPNWKTSYMSRADFAYDNYEEIVKVSNEICKVNFNIYMEHLVGQLLCFPTDYILTSVETPLDRTYSGTIRQNFKKITDWTIVRTVKSVLLRTKNIEDIVNIRIQTLNLFNDETITIDKWEIDNINYFAENAISMPFQDMILPFQHIILLSIFQNCEGKYRINLLYRYHCIYKGYLGIDTSCLKIKVDYTDTTIELLNKLIDGLMSVDTNYIWRNARMYSYDSDFDLFWSINATLFNTNSQYVQQYINKRLIVKQTPVTTKSNPNNNIKIKSILVDSWIKYNNKIISIELFGEISDKLYQNNYDYTKKYLNSFNDKFICALSLIKFCNKINKDTSQSFVYSMWAIYDYIKEYGYIPSSTASKPYNQNSDFAKGIVYYTLNGKDKIYYKNKESFTGDIYTAEIHAYILVVFESNDEWKMISGNIVSDFYNVFKYSPNVENANMYLQSMVIKYDNERVDTVSKIVNFVQSNNYQETKPIMIQGISELNLISILPSLTIGMVILFECRYKSNINWSNPRFYIGVIAENGDTIKGIIPRVRMLYFSDDSETWVSVKDSILRETPEDNLDGNTMKLKNGVLHEGTYIKIKSISTYKINDDVITLNPGDSLIYLFNSWKIINYVNMDDDHQILWPIITNGKSIIYNNIWTYLDYEFGYSEFKTFTDLLSQTTNTRAIVPINTEYESLFKNCVSINDFIKKAKIVKSENVKTVKYKTPSIDKLDKILSRTIGTTDTLKLKLNDFLSSIGISINSINQSLYIDILNNFKTNLLFQYVVLNNKNLLPITQNLREIKSEDNPLETIITKMRTYYRDTNNTDIIDYTTNNSKINNDINNYTNNNTKINIDINNYTNNNTQIDIDNITDTNQLLNLLCKKYPNIKILDENGNVNGITILDDDGNEVNTDPDQDITIDYIDLDTEIKKLNFSDKPFFSYDEICEIEYFNNIKIYNYMCDNITENIILETDNNDIFLNIPDLSQFKTIFDIDEFQNFDITIPGSTRIVSGEYAFDVSCVLYNILKVNSYDVAHYLANAIQTGNAKIDIPGTLSIEIPNTDLYIGCIKMACLRDEYYYSWYGFLQISQMTTQEINYMSKYDLVSALNVCITQGMNKIPYNAIFKSALDAGASKIIQLMIASNFVDDYIKNASAVFTPLDNTRVNPDGDKSGFPTFTTLSNAASQLISAMRKDKGKRFTYHGKNILNTELSAYRLLNVRSYEHFLILPESEYLAREYVCENNNYYNKFIFYNSVNF